METNKLTKTKSQSKQAKAAVLAPQAVKTVQTNNTSLPFEYVTSWRLKRSKPLPGVEYSQVATKMPIDTWRQLQLLGIKYGVTQDEIILGLIDRELADVNNGSTLSHFIPVLNL